MRPRINRGGRSRRVGRASQDSGMVRAGPAGRRDERASSRTGLNYCSSAVELLYPNQRVDVDTAPRVRDRFNVMNAESFPFMRFFEPLVRTSSSRRVAPSDRRTDAW